VLLLALVSDSQGRSISAHIGREGHCKNGHPYSPENTYTNSKGQRFCVACRNIRNKQYQQRKREELGDWLWVKQRQNGHLTG
jgi:hypothetical protein